MIALSSDARREQSGCLTERNNPQTREILNCDFYRTALRATGSFRSVGQMPSRLQCGRWRQGHTSLERKHDYDTDRNEVYGFVDVVIDEAGVGVNCFRRDLVTVFAVIV